MAVITICSDFGAQENKICHFFPIYLPWSDWNRCHDLVFWMLSFKPTFSLSSFPFIKRFFSSSSKFSKPGFNSTWTVNFQMFKLDLEKAEEPEIKLPTSVESSKKQESLEKYLLLLYWLCQSLWLCRSQQTVENSERDGNTRPPDLPLEKSVCKSGSNS